jgi:hypothetical protein
MHSFSFASGFNIQGRFMSDYSPVSPGSSWDWKNMGPYDAGHPIMVGADSLRDRWSVNITTANSPFVVGTYRDGSPAVVYNWEKPVVAVNGYVGDSGRQFSGDMVMISHNAINYAINGPGEILFLMADNGATETKRGLEAYPDIHGVEYYRASYATPTLEYLQHYNAIVVWSNNSFNNATTLGNRLADYVDLGGAVVMTQFCFYLGTNYGMSGRLQSSYSPFSTGDIRYAWYSLGVHQPSHPLMAGVDEMTTYYSTAVNMQNGGVSVASLDDSTPFVAFHPGTSTVGINAFYGANSFYPMEGDWLPLLHNAILFARGDVGIDEFDPSLPDKVALSQNYPNPFNPSTSIAFDLPRKEHVKLSVYNLLGQELTRLADREFEAGRHEVIFNAESFSSGVYFYKLRTSDETFTKKMTILK